MGLHKDRDKLVAHLWDHLCIVHSRVLVLLHHVFVQDQPLLNVLLIWLHTALPHLGLCQFLPAILVQTLAVQQNEEKHFVVEVGICLAGHLA